MITSVLLQAVFFRPILSGCGAGLQMACVLMQVGGKAGFAWEKKWWEEAYESKLQNLQVLIHHSISSQS